MSQTCYATLYDARLNNGANSPADDVFLIRALRSVSKRIDMLLTDPRLPRPFFAPYTEARKVLISAYITNWRLGTLDLPAPLLALTSVDASGTPLTIGTQVNAYPNAGVPPFTGLQLSADYCQDWYYFCSTTLRQPYATITGAWGYSSNFAYAWQQVDTLAAAMTDTTTTTLTVHTVDSAGTDGNTPTFSPGNLIQIDSELMNVTAVNNATKVVTVASRGDNGSTAATHLNGAAIKVWQVEPDIRDVVAKQAGLINSRKAAFTTVEVDPAGVELRYPPDLLPELRATLQPYSYLG